jgi:hypothetical protein
MHPPMRRAAATFASVAAVGFALAGCDGGGGSGAGATTSEGSPARVSESIPQPPEAQLKASGLAKFPFAPEGTRIDLEAPTFSNPTEITNPLNPISEIPSAIVLGEVDGEPLRIEITLLPETRLVEWNGRAVETRVSQFVAYRDGHMKEVALDLYAQADSGDVWYFGEDVFNYADDGHVADMEGAWLAGRDGPAGMITPADPRVGDAYRSENIPGLVFEESTVMATDETVGGPRGPVDGAFVIDEHHPDGPEVKKWAPGYGEFFTRDWRDFEQLALAVPIDALPGPPPVELTRLSAGAAEIFDAPARIEWRGAAAAVEEMSAEWSQFKRADTPKLLSLQMGDALDSLERAVQRQHATDSRLAAVAVAVASLDFQLRHRPPAEIDLARLELQAALLEIDASAGDVPAVRSDVANLDWIRDRIAHALAVADLSRIDTELVELIGATADRDLTAAGNSAARLRQVLADVQPTG